MYANTYYSSLKVEGKLLITSGNNTVSPLSLLKNPMILLAVFALAVTFGMPYLIENSTFFLKSMPDFLC